MKLEEKTHGNQTLEIIKSELLEYKDNISKISKYLQDTGCKTQTTDELESVLIRELPQKIQLITQPLINKIRTEVLSKINLLLNTVEKQDMLIENLLVQVSDTNKEKDKLSESYLKLKSNNVKLEELASTDALTGLKNVRGLEQEINKLIKKYIEGKINNGVSICLIDIDDFKKINDTHGHNNGDIVLINLALLLKNYFGPDLYSTFRKGGEEFVIISELNIIDFTIKVDKFLDVIKSNPLKIQSGKKVNITCSGSIVNTKKLEGGKIKPQNGKLFSKKEVYDIITSTLSMGLNEAKAIPGKGQIVSK